MMMPQSLRRSTSMVVCGALLSSTTACYDYVRVETAPPSGERVAFEISDRGRVALAERFGPGLAEIEGTLAGAQGDQYVINVRRTAQIDGTSSTWSGEETRISREFVGSVRTRKLSKVRTALLVGAVAAGLGATAFAGLAGSLSESETTPEPKMPASLRIPIHP
jgi:hypothetical protein